MSNYQNYECKNHEISNDERQRYQHVKISIGENNYKVIQGGRCMIHDVGNEDSLLHLG